MARACTASDISDYTTYQLRVSATSVSMVACAGDPMSCRKGFGSVSNATPVWIEWSAAERRCHVQLQDDGSGTLMSVGSDRYMNLYDFECCADQARTTPRHRPSSTLSRTHRTAEAAPPPSGVIAISLPHTAAAALCCAYIVHPLPSTRTRDTTGCARLLTQATSEAHTFADSKAERTLCDSLEPIASEPDMRTEPFGCEVCARRHWLRVLLGRLARVIRAFGA